ncbi:MAG: hypothetical protein PXX77_09195 [Gallionella sp.]|nr:hypothetical protein [Gallionella sp.]
MRHHKTQITFRLSWNGMAHLLAMSFLICSWSAEATAPRIAPKMFGEEKKIDIVGYQFAPLETTAKADNKLVLEIVTEAFKAAGKKPAVDVLPSKQLAKYALSNNDAMALMGNSEELTAKEKKQYRAVAFYLREISRGKEPVSLIFNKKDAHGNELYQAFNTGLRKIIKSGKYLEIIEGFHGKDQIPADYVDRLKRLNPGWK